MPPLLILLQCGQRAGHFGQGSFTNSLIPHFKKKKNVELMVILTDVTGIYKPTLTTMKGTSILSIPPLLRTGRLTGESFPQEFYAHQLTGILYEYLHQRHNIILWVNTIDYLNVCTEIRKVMPFIKIFYVHHSFSWKYLLNTSDQNFKLLWEQKNVQSSPKAFEMTEYQRKMAIISDRTITVTDHAKKMFVDILQVPIEKIQTILLIAQFTINTLFTCFFETSKVSKCGFR